MKAHDAIPGASSAASSISRRTWLGAATLVVAVAASRLVATASAATKVTKKDASYQDQPKGKQAMCAQCKYFQPPNSCMVVEGTISPTGWCQRFEKKS